MRETMMQRLTGRSRSPLHLSGSNVKSAIRKTVGRESELNASRIIPTVLALGVAAGIYYFFPEMRRYFKMYRM